MSQCPCSFAFLSLAQTSFISEKTLLVAALVPGILRQNSTIVKTLAQGISCWWKCVNSSTHRLSTSPCAYTSTLRMLNRDKSGTPGQKRDKLASRETSDFFGGLEVKNRDCPGKSGMDGHLIFFLRDKSVKYTYSETGGYDSTTNLSH